MHIVETKSISGNRASCAHAWAIALAAITPQEGFSQTAKDENGSAPIAIDVAYTAEVWTLSSRSEDSNVQYLDNLDIIVNADLDALIGAKYTMVSVYGLYNNGAAFTGDVVGDVLTISNIEAPAEAFRLYEAWIDHRFRGGPVSARFGLYDLNSEFDALETSSFFIGSAHGIGADISQSGETGPSIFPITSLALRVDYEVNDNFLVRAAMLDGVAGDPDNLKKTTVKISEHDGALMIAEADYRWNGARMIGGAWRYTTPVQRYDGLGQEQNYGFYIRGEANLFQRGDAPGELNAFFRAGWANGAVSDFSSFYSAGLVFDGLFIKRGGDQLGVAVAYAETSTDFRAVNAASMNHETVVEMSYRTPLTDWFSVQPNIQYVVNPGLDPLAENALVFGLRAEVGWSREFGR